MVPSVSVAWTTPHSISGWDLRVIYIRPYPRALYVFYKAGQKLESFSQIPRTLSFGLPAGFFANLKEHSFSLPLPLPLSYPE